MESINTPAAATTPAVCYFVGTTAFAGYEHRPLRRISRKSGGLGVIGSYIGRTYTLEEINALISSFFERKPFIKGADWVDLTIMYHKDGLNRVLHTLRFLNPDASIQEPDDGLLIRFTK